MFNIFLTPEIIPSTSTTRKFHNVDYIKSRLYERRKDYVSWSLKKDNSFWLKAIQRAMHNLRFSGNQDKDCIHISNMIFEEMQHKVHNHDVNSYTAFKYFWNRLAYHTGRLDLVIDRVLIRQGANFRPTIAKSKIYSKTAQSLIINRAYIQYKNGDVFMRYVQLLFSYMAEPENRNQYGRWLKEKITKGKIKNCPTDYKAMTMKYSSKEEYVLPTMHGFDSIVKSPIHRHGSKLTKHETKEIESLNQEQLTQVYMYIIEMIHKG